MDPEKTNQPTLGEISTIRNILMGEHINEFENSFSELKKEIAALEASQSQDLSSTKNELEARLDEVEDTMTKRLDSIEKNLNHSIEELKNLVQESIVSSNNNLGALLKTVGEQLIK